MGKRSREQRRQQARASERNRVLDEDAALVCEVESLVDNALRRGWQPADVARFVRRRLTTAEVNVVVDAIAHLHLPYAAATIDRRWADQVDALHATVWWRSTDSYVDQRAERDSLPRTVVLGSLLEVRALLRWVPDLPKLLPRPGESWTSSRTSGVDGKLLARVRALLAKAESTTFKEDSHALTAKAQELMARHAIDEAMVAASQGERVHADGRRIGVDDPYASAKSLLLSRVAHANRCRSVWMGEFGCSDVFGAGNDLDAVELLFTSLLRQATTAMLADGQQRRGQGGGGATRSFRQSFLVAFAIRIGMRLQEQAADTVAEAAETHGPGLLPVLASRETAAEEALAEAHPRRRRHGASAHDPAGWLAGTAAADVANLGIRAQVEA